MTNLYFWVRFPIFSFLIGMIIKGLELIRPTLLMPYIWVFFLLYVLMIPGIYLFALWGSLQKGGSSVWYILASELLKMVFSLFFAALVIFKFHPEPRVFGFNFFILYILFSSFEIHCLLHNLRRQKN